MKEIESEIENATKRGKEYAVQTGKNAISVIELINKSFWGKRIMERSEGGGWVARKVKPGITDILRIRFKR